MAAHASELEIAKKNLTDAIGDNVKQYVKPVFKCILFSHWTFQRLHMFAEERFHYFVGAVNIC